MSGALCDVLERLLVQLLTRVLDHPKSTAGGLLSVAGVMFIAFSQTFPGRTWVVLGTLIVSGLTGLLSQDK